MLKMRERAGETVGSQIQAAEGEIGKAFAALEEVQAIEGEGLQFTPAGLAQRKREHLVIAEVKKEFGGGRRVADGRRLRAPDRRSARHDRARG